MSFGVYNPESATELAIAQQFTTPKQHDYFDL